MTSGRLSNIVPVKTAEGTSSDSQEEPAQGVPELPSDPIQSVRRGLSDLNQRFNTPETRDVLRRVVKTVRKASPIAVPAAIAVGALAKHWSDTRKDSKSKNKKPIEQTPVKSASFDSLKTDAGNAILKSLDWTKQKALSLPFLDTPEERNAARVIAKYGLGAAGLGGLAAAVMSHRRKKARELLRREPIKATLPVLVPDQKLGSMDKEAVGALGKLGVKALPYLLGGIPLGYGAYKSVTRPLPESQAQPKPLADPNDKRSFWDKVTEWSKSLTTYEAPSGSNSRLYNGGADIAKGIYRLFTGTKANPNPPTADPSEASWFLPGALFGVTGLGALGYYGLDKHFRAKAENKLKKEREAAKRKFEAALLAEQQSKLGSALDEFVDVYQEKAPLEKLAFNFTSNIKGGLGTLALLILYLSAKKGYAEGSQTIQLSAEKKQRDKVLARRQLEGLSLVPRPVPQTEMKNIIQEELPEFSSEIYNNKTSSYLRTELPVKLPVMDRELVKKKSSELRGVDKLAGMFDSVVKGVAKGSGKQIVRNTVKNAPKVKLKPARPAPKPVLGDAVHGPEPFRPIPAEPRLSDVSQLPSLPELFPSRYQPYNVKGFKPWLDDWWKQQGRSLGLPAMREFRFAPDPSRSPLQKPLTDFRNWSAENPVIRNLMTLGGVGTVGGLWGRSEYPNLIGGYNPYAPSQVLWERLQRARGLQRMKDHQGNIMNGEWEPIANVPNLTPEEAAAVKQYAESNLPALNESIDPVTQAQRDRNY